MLARLCISDPGKNHVIELDAEPGEKLSAAIWLSGRVQPIPLCGGLGLCGRCRCRFDNNAPAPVPEEHKIFSESELAAGWRLACHHTTHDTPLQLELPQLSPYSQTGFSYNGPTRQGCLAVDLGTTSIQWQALDPESGPIAHGSLWNPQAGAGADVISRLQAATDAAGRHRLSMLVRRSLAGIIHELAYAGIAIGHACIAANSVMTAILLGKDISGLAHAPYSLSFHGNEVLALDLPDGLSLSVYFPPLPAPFVGADISAGLLSLLEKGAEPPFLLADLGTNAELALMDTDKRLFLASAPLGPAMEGIGPRCGQPAGPGVITSFTAGPAGLVPHAANGSYCAGISATGYLSLLAILLSFRVMDSTGHLHVACPMPIACKMAQGLSEGTLPLPCGQFLTSHDIELLLKVKATLAVTITRILAAANLTPNDLTSLYLAGALGEHASSSDLSQLGFIPPQLAVKTISCGNTALAGAAILATHPQKGIQLETLCKQAVIIDLASDPHFLDDYMSAMRWGSHAA